MNDSLFKIFNICREAKKHQIDAFFYFFPHENKVEVNLHKDGWATCSKEDFKAIASADDENELKALLSKIESIIKQKITPPRAYIL